MTTYYRIALGLDMTKWSGQEIEDFVERLRRHAPCHGVLHSHATVVITGAEDVDGVFEYALPHGPLRWTVFRWVNVSVE
jgi:hypothetical protein